MIQKKKLNLKELEIHLPQIESNKARVILSGNDYSQDSFLVVTKGKQNDKNENYQFRKGSHRAKSSHQTRQLPLSGIWHY